MLIKGFKLETLSFDDPQGAYISAEISGIKLRKARVLLTPNGAKLMDAAYWGFTSGQTADIDAALTKEILFAIVQMLSRFYWDAYRPMAKAVKGRMDRKGVTVERLKDDTTIGEDVLDDFLSAASRIHYKIGSLEVAELSRELDMPVMDLLLPVAQSDADMYRWALECGKEILDMKLAEYIDLCGYKTVPIDLVNAMDTGHTLRLDDCPDLFRHRLGVTDTESYHVYKLSDGSIVLRPGSHRCICCQCAEGLQPYMGHHFCSRCQQKIGKLSTPTEGD